MAYGRSGRTPVPRTETGGHDDDGARRVGRGQLQELFAVEFLAKNKFTVGIDADDVEPVLAQIDAPDMNGFVAFIFHEWSPKKRLSSLHLSRKGGADHSINSREAVLECGVSSDDR